jgi:hypothetical protein
MIKALPWAESGRGPLLPTLAWGLAFTLSVASLSLAMLGLFLRFANRPSLIFDSLQRNAFGIYIIHYVFVTWTALIIVAASRSRGVRSQGFQP